jgi:hypothetical protein
MGNEDDKIEDFTKTWNVKQASRKERWEAARERGEACGCWDDEKTEPVYSPGWGQWLCARCHEPWPEKLVVSEETVIRAPTKPLPQTR